MLSAYNLAIISAGLFFLCGLLTGIWKYRQMTASHEGIAHRYVDIAHRASLLYSFAAILLAKFVEISQLGDTLELIAVALPLAYFAIAILNYIAAGIKKQTDNMVRDRGKATGFFVWTLVAAELGGFLVLFYGVLATIF